MNKQNFVYIIKKTKTNLTIEQKYKLITLMFGHKANNTKVYVPLYYYLYKYQELILCIFLFVIECFYPIFFTYCTIN